MPSGEPILNRVVESHLRDQPDDVTVVEVAVRRRTRPTNCFKKGTIYGHCDLRPPTPKRRDLDLQLRHQALRTRRPPIRSPDCTRKRRLRFPVASDALEPGLHGRTGEVNGLNLQTVPRDSAPGSLGDDKIDLPGRFTRAGTLHERHFSRQHRLPRGKPDDLCKPIDDHLPGFESDRAHDGRQADLTIFTRLVTLEGTDAAPFPTRRAGFLKRTRWCNLDGPERRLRQLPTLVRGKTRKGPALPFRDSVTRVHSTKTFRDVMTSSGMRA